MKKILVSLSVVAAVAAIAIGATTAFFSDTETSEGNIFQAGGLDLKVDSHAYYNGVEITVNDGWGTWGETDLVNEMFFNLLDVKPGDEGENTISLHVYDNDAWGLFTVTNLTEDENGMTEPESEVDNTPDAGELASKLLFTAWLDQGSIPGFQNIQPDPSAPGEYIDTQIDSEEGDNLMTTSLEEAFWNGELADANSWELKDVLSAAYADAYELCPEASVDGHNDYDLCHGLAEDGRMVGSTTYYFGLGWILPGIVENEIQTDSMTADMTFRVEQHRNNPTPSW